MADLTGIFSATGIVKGQSNTITLNKTLLNALFSDAYFDVLTNWKQVIATYKSVDGQLNDVVFDTVNDLAGDFNPTSLAKDSTWEIQSITIMDFDNGYLKLLRGDLTTADFDILLNAVVVGFDAGLVNGNFTLSNNGLTAEIANSEYPAAAYTCGYVGPAIATTGNTDKVYIEFTYTQAVWSGFFGLGLFNSDPTNFATTIGNPKIFGDNGLFYPSNGAGGVTFYVDGVGAVNYNCGFGLSVGEVLTIAIDFNLEKIWLGKAGSWGAGNNPEVGSEIGGQPFDKTKGSELRFGAGVYATSTHATPDIIDLNPTPVNVLAGYTYIS